MNMTAGQSITVDISPAGTINIEASGFRGNSCEKATAPLEVVLGGGEVKRNRKPEFSLPPTSTQQAIKRTF